MAGRRDGRSSSIITKLISLRTSLPLPPRCTGHSGSVALTSGDLSLSIDIVIQRRGIFQFNRNPTLPRRLPTLPTKNSSVSLSLPSNELMPMETKVQRVTVATAAVATDDTNGKGQGQKLIHPRKKKAKLSQIFPDECRPGKPSKLSDEHAGNCNDSASGEYDGRRPSSRSF